jgi:Zn-dependent metalloprotease
MGSENYIYSKAQGFVADKWDIELLRVAGISVDRNIVDSVSIENESMWKRLDGALKLDSKKLFQKEVGAEIRKIVKAEKALKSNRAVKRLRRRIENRKVKTFSELESKRNEWTYVYTIYSNLKNIYTDNPRIKEFDVIIDLENGTTVTEKPDANNG